MSNTWYQVIVTLRKSWGEVQVDTWENQDLESARSAANNSIKNRTSTGLSKVMKIEERTVKK